MCRCNRCRLPCVLIGPCRPKWMRMVDNLYSGNPQEPHNQNKLIYYCLHQPDKLDRIAKYLYKRLAQDVHRRYDPYMYIAIDAINVLLKECRCQRLVLAQEFLRMVHLLLQTNQTDLQILAANSFVEFSQLEDEVPNYFKEYNDLIDHFTFMAHASLRDVKERNRVRRAGICGIQGVVRKTVDDQIHLDVVHGPNMDKIIPSLLLNICEKPDVDPQDPQEDPSQEAVFVFKDIVRRASYNNIKPVIKSILTHLDNHHLWRQPDFPLLIFQYLLDSIENTQIAHGLVKQLVDHLSLHESDFSLPERTCVVQVIGLTVIGLAKGAIGPDVFHNFKALLQILRASIDKTPQALELTPDNRMHSTYEERQFQDAIINTIAEFAKNLPDTQKIEILKFILNFEPMAKYHPQYGARPRPLIMVLLQTMLTVATQYKTVAISNALNSDFLNLLLRGVAVDPDPAIRIIVQKILHTLIDRHGNAERLLKVDTYIDKPLDSYFVWEEPSRQDILFMKQTGVLFTENIYHQLLDSSNKVDCLEHLFCTVGLVALEMGADQVIGELFRLTLAVQEKICDEPPVLPLPHRCALHALLAGAISLLVQLADLPDLRTHVKEVIEARQAEAPYLLPSVAFNRSNTTESYPTELDLHEEWLFSVDRVSAALSGAGYDISNLCKPYHPVYVKLYDSINPDPLQHGSSALPGGRLQLILGGLEANLSYGVPGQEQTSNLTSKTPFFDPSKSAWVNESVPPNVRDRDRDSGLGVLRSESSYSLTDSLYSQTDSAKAVDELLCFRSMQRIVSELPIDKTPSSISMGTSASRRRKYEGHDKRKSGRALEEEDRLLHSYNTDFSDIFVEQRDKTISARAQLAEIMDDISVELHPGPNDTNFNQRKLFPRDSPSELDQASRSKFDFLSPTTGGQGKRKKDQQRPPATWERDYGSLFTS
ncbi:hypothetical protein CRM22_011138 [Opisthorchis felineus]|uniref:Protein EFR3 homolog B n=1 Tax=Opisthorchis felineus TaxID=147828 RepID=A0A4S2KEV1_OPIFE|nr:hypothetical protein CRM22_011138 [Opisthorchis felineus]